MSTEQELGHRIWTIVELFYRSHAVFAKQFDNYEEKVQNYSRVTGMDRDQLRLNSAELASLLDLKDVERLRDDYIQQLKDLCHLVFRGHDQTDLLDRYVSDIFHEISILKEEHYNVKTYAPLYERDAAEIELRHILDEAHRMFPQKLKHIQYLFGRARARLEDHLPSFCRMPVFIRSLFLDREGFVRLAYPDGIERFYWLMYPLGPLQGFYEVGTSFYLSGFFKQAAEAFDLAEAAYGERLQEGVATGLASARSDVSREVLYDEQRGRVHALLRAMRQKRQRLEAAFGADARDDALSGDGERWTDHDREAPGVTGGHGNGTGTSSVAKPGAVAERGSPSSRKVDASSVAEANS